MKKKIFLFTFFISIIGSNLYALADEGSTTICPGSGASCIVKAFGIPYNAEKNKNGPSVIITF